MATAPNRRHLREWVNYFYFISYDWFDSLEDVTTDCIRDKISLPSFFAMDATTMFIVLGQHYLNARQVILSARQMAQEVQASVQDTSSLEVLILKRGKRKSSAVELLPGDIFVMSQTADGDLVIPVDALLLDGQGLRFRRRGRRVWVISDVWWMSPERELPGEVLEFRLSHTISLWVNALDSVLRRSRLFEAGASIKEVLNHQLHPSPSIEVNRIACWTIDL
jgi:hypothetical protein